MSRPPSPRIGQQTLANLERAKDLRRRGDDRQAETLLEALIEKEEADAGQRGVEHWYYEHLAVLYDERGDYHAEVRVLERYAKQRPASPAMATMMAERLADARQRADR